MPDHATMTDAGVRRMINAQFYTKSMPTDFLIFSYCSLYHFDLSPGLVNTINGKTEYSMVPKNQARNISMTLLPGVTNDILCDPEKLDFLNLIDAPEPNKNCRFQVLCGSNHNCLPH
jgi:hypothetical protein